MSDRQNARAGLAPARAAVSRLGQIGRGGEDAAADLIEVWQSIEDSLRSLVGSTVLSGQALIREARLRQFIDFAAANALAEFGAVHDRLQNVSYSPTAADVESARTSVQRLDAALESDGRVAEPGAAAAPAAAPAPSPVPLTGEVSATPIVAGASGPRRVGLPPRRFPIWVLATGGVFVFALLVIGGYYMFGARRSTALEQGIDAYRAGQRQIAESDFNRAVREDPSAPLPHIYLARMAREVGNTTLASQELQLALQADPTNALALREMGANLLAQGNYELARRFYVRAVQADPTDMTAMGYLGCTLMRLNRATEAANFLNRAGPGPWANCTPAPATDQAGRSGIPR